jgi:hypothetical protein
MYGKLFDSMYDSTLADDWRAMITFQQLIVMCDADGVVDMTPHAIARRTGIPIEHIEAGITILEAPDPYSRTPENEGRRIARLDEHRPWGWYIVNHRYYRDLKDSDEVRARNRDRKRKQRERDKEKSQDVPGCHTQSHHTDTDIDINKCASFDAFWVLYPRKVDKKKARVVWSKLPLSKQKLAMADIETRYQGLNKQYIPNPINYITGERWNDEPYDSYEEESIFIRAARSM